MTIPNPEHLFEQAERLIRPATGAPRQVDVRRAISSAYYGVFHATLTAAADQFVGRSNRSSTGYMLAYRSVDHSSFRRISNEVAKEHLSAKYARYEPEEGFGGNMRAFAEAAVELQDKRHSADYDPRARFDRSDASLAIDLGRVALRRFGEAELGHRRAFLALLLFSPR